MDGLGRITKERHKFLRIHQENGSSLPVWQLEEFPFPTYFEVLKETTVLAVAALVFVGIYRTLYQMSFLTVGSEPVILEPLHQCAFHAP